MEGGITTAATLRSTFVDPRPGHMRMETLRVLAPTRYPWTFNGPRASRHRIEHRNFLPLNYINKRLEGITAFAPFPMMHFDLVHAFNRIPLGNTPFIIGFESHLPRCFGAERTSYAHALTRVLAGPRCRGIIAISDHAADIFRRQHAGSPYEKVLLSKLSRIYPNVPIAACPPLEQPIASQAGQRKSLSVAFVGNHFGRKGGCTAVRVAELALQARLPITVDIVSNLEVGGAIWTDPLDDAAFEPYKAMLALPNVRLQRALPNSAVQALLARADVLLLTTLGDTFGYSAVEAMACGTPVIATRQGALPEFIENGTNGFLLPLATTAIREWVHLGSRDRSSPHFVRAYLDTVERLARETIEVLRQILDKPAEHAAMRHRAFATAAQLFDADGASARWDAFYERALSRRVEQTEQADA